MLENPTLDSRNTERNFYPQKYVYEIQGKLYNLLQFGPSFWGTPYMYAQRQK